MAKIIKLFDREQRGYKMIPPTMIDVFFSKVHGQGANTFAIKQFDGLVVDIIAQGAISDKDTTIDPVKLRQTQLQLINFLDDHHGWAEANIAGIPTSIVKNQDIDNGFCSIFVKCKNGIIGCAWSSEDTKFSQIMAAFVIYALGLQNVRYDEILYMSSYYYLPRKQEIGFVRVADEAYVEGLSKAKFGT